MMTVDTKRWSVDLLIGEQDGSTYAEARLRTELGDNLVGVGHAQLHPEDRDVPEIGDELAAARALTDLGHRLLMTTSRDIAQVTHEHVKLDR